MESKTSISQRPLANQPDELLLETYKKMSVPDLLQLRNVSRKFAGQITPEVMIESAFNDSISTIEEAVTIAKIISACPRRKQRQALLNLADNLPHKPWSISLLEQSVNNYLEACSEKKVSLASDDPKRDKAALRKFDDRSTRYGDEAKNRLRVRSMKADELQADESAFRLHEIKDDLVNEEEYCWAQGHRHL